MLHFRSISQVAALWIAGACLGAPVTDPNDPRSWQGATVGTFAQLIYGADTEENRQLVIDSQLLDDGIFDVSTSTPAQIMATPWTAGGGGCLGRSHDDTGTGSYSYSCDVGSVFEAANTVDNLWFQSSGRIGDTVFDLGGPATKAAIFNTIDHGPLPGEAIESTAYLSNDLENWTQAVLERVWLEGFEPNTGILWDGFAFAVGTGTSDVFRYVSIIHGGPGALLRDGDDEINGVVGLSEDYSPICPNFSIDFETIAGSPSVEGSTIVDQFKRSLGVSFDAVGVEPILAQVGEPLIAFTGFDGVADTPAPGVEVGEFFLTTSRDGNGLPSIALQVVFSHPVAGASGMLLDVDNSEAWSIAAFDPNGQLIGTDSVVASGGGSGSPWSLAFESPRIARVVIYYAGAGPQDADGAPVLDNLSFDCPTLTCPGSGDCCVPHSGRGCNDSTCCEMVCAQDPACCQGAGWDEQCVMLADAVCGPLPILNCRCPVVSILPRGDRYDESLTTLRRFRDEILADSTDGQRLISLYYEHAGEVQNILSGNLDMRRNAVSLALRMTPKIASMLEDGAIQLTRDDIEAITTFSRKVQRVASPGLEEDLHSFDRQIRAGKSVIFGKSRDATR